MEVAGLAVGVVSLFSTCTDALEKVDTYRAFSHESRQLVARFEADKKRFQDWAAAVGISNEKLEEIHSPQLDDPEVVSCVKLVLQCLCEILGAAEKTQSSLPTKERPDGKPSNREFPTTANNTMGGPQVSRRSKLYWTFRQKEKFVDQVNGFKELLENLHNLVPPSSLTRRGTDVMETLQDKDLRSSKVSTSLKFNLQILLQQTQENARLETLKAVDYWLDAVPSDRQLGERLEARLQGTCQWIFDNPMFQSWVQPDESTDSKLLWINGSAGHGKSVLCASIVEYLQSRKNPCAYFFSSAHATTQQPKDVARSWLSQLARQSTDTLYAIQGNRRAQDERDRALQSKIWEVLEDVAQDNPQSYFILDGLDEYNRNNDSRASFLRTLKSTLKGTAARVLIVSRDEVDIRQEIVEDNMEGWKFFDCRILGADIRPDIALFSQHVVNQKLPKRSKDVRQNVAELMAGKSDGMFLWIDLQKEKLKTSLRESELKTVIQRMPVGISNVYEGKWETIKRRNSEEEMERAVAILRWVVFADRPLTVAELTDALLANNPDDEDFPLDDLPEAIDNDYINEQIKDICGSLIDLKDSKGTPGSQTVEILHFTVKEFLLSVLPSSLGPSFLQISTIPDMSHHHIILAETCLRYLNFSRVWQDSAAQENDVVRPFVEYASRSWSSHYRAGYEPLQFILREFLDENNPNFRNWRTYFELSYVPEKGDSPEANFEPSSPLYYSALFNLIPDEIDGSHQGIQRDLNRAEGRFGSPLSIVGSKGNIAAFNWLLGLGADINTEGGQSGSALNAAIETNQEEIVTTLLGLGATQRAKDFMGRSSLYIAAWKGHHRLLKLLLQHGGDVHAPNKWGYTPLSAACTHGHLQTVRILLDHGADVSTPNCNGWTAIESACVGGYIDIIKLLISKDVNQITATDSKGWTPLHIASHHNHLNVVELLLDNEADISTPNIDNITPIKSACDSGNLAVAQLLLDRGADPEIANKGGWSPLNGACERGNLDIVKLLLGKGASLTSRNNEGWMPLSTACIRGHFEIVQLLIGKGADISATNDNQITPLHAACIEAHDIEQHLKIIQLLLDNGADLTSPDKDGTTALITASRNGYFEIVQFLLSKGARRQISKPGKHGETALHHACKNGHLRIVQLLVDQGADLDPTDDDGWTPTKDAATTGRLEILRLLIDRGADFSIPSTQDWTPFHSACNNGHLEIAQLLLDKGTNLATKNTAGWTPLNSACESGHLEMVKFLLEKGADISIPNNNGWTPLNSACNPGHLEIVQFLLDRGAEQTSNHTGWSPLNNACNNGHLKVAQLLLESGADLEGPSEDGWRPFNSACDSGHLEVAMFLLDKGADVTAPNSSGRTPLHSACYSGHLKIVQLLLKKCDDILTSRDELGHDPLICAASKGHDAIVKLLLAQDKIDVNSKDKLNRSALSFAAKDNHAAVIRQLLATGALDVDHEDAYGCTPLSIAARNGCIEAVKMLLATMQVDIYTEDCFGRTPLAWAQQHKHENVAQLLVAFKDLGASAVATLDDPVKDDKLQREDLAWCDICMLTAPEPYYQCSLCWSFILVVCVDCYELGKRCLDNTHEMVFVEGKKIDQESG